MIQKENCRIANTIAAYYQVKDSYKPILLRQIVLIRLKLQDLYIEVLVYHLGSWNQ